MQVSEKSERDKAMAELKALWELRSHPHVVSFRGACYWPEEHGLAVATDFTDGGTLVRQTNGISPPTNPNHTGHGGVTAPSAPGGVTILNSFALIHPAQAELLRRAGRLPEQMVARILRQAGQV